MYIERLLEKKIRKYLRDREIICIVGARQCGKTTLMKRVFGSLENAKFISFDDRDILDMFNNNVNNFIEKFVEGTRYLFIDEFQYAKEGGKQLKFIYDSHDVKIIISGSSAAELSVHSIKYLVGRILVFTLHPLSFGEYLNFKDKKLYGILGQKSISDAAARMINRYYDEFVIYGGYPRVALENDLEKKRELLKNIYNTYLLREIKEILQIAEDEKINRIIKALALQVGSIASINEISNITETESSKLKKYLRTLEMTFVCIRSRPYFRNKRKELVKAPRFYFLDNGFRNIALDNMQPLESRADHGALNENFAASEIIKKELAAIYWRTKAGAEVDFIVEKSGELLPIEVKTSLRDVKYTRSFRNFIAEYGPKRGLILSKSFQKEAKLGGSRITFAPIFLLSRFL